MRILTVGNRYPPWSTGGYEVVWARAVDALRAAGHAVTVLTTQSDPSDRPHSAPGPSETHRELLWYWRDHEFPPASLRQTVAIERHNAGVLSGHLEPAPDVVLWWAMGGMSLSLIEQVRRAGIPAVGLVGDEWMVYGPAVDGWTRRWRRWPRPAAALIERVMDLPASVDLDGGARWLFNSEYLLAAAREAGWKLPSAGVLPPGVDLARFRAQPAEQWRWRLLCLGRLDPRKGIGIAVEALAELPAEAELSVVGDGDAAYERELRSLASRIGVAERVRFSHAEHADVAGVYAAHDAVVFPVSWREPWGLVPLEAMAAGRPLVASRAGGGPAEYLEEDRNCLQFESGDAVALAAAVKRLAGDEPLRLRLVAGGDATAARFSEDSFHRGLLDAIERAVESGPPASKLTGG